MPDETPRKKVQAWRVSGHVLGPCAACGKEERALLMCDEQGWVVECLACGSAERVDDVEYVPEGDVTD